MSTLASTNKPTRVSYNISAQVLLDGESFKGIHGAMEQVAVTDAEAEDVAGGHHIVSFPKPFYSLGI